VTGLPVRGAIAGADKGEAYAYFQLSERKKTVLAVGGSQGALQINRAMLHVVRQLYRREDVQVLFATGRRDYPQMTEELETAAIPWEISAGEESNIRMLPYIDRMDLAYALSPIYIGRAGASTLAEVTLSRLPAILIPLPFASENHQAYNAASLADKGGAVVLEDQKLTGQVLLAALQELLADGPRRQAMAECSYNASYSRALDDILDILEGIMIK
jgi:UDP-N-acetylglucosamine--N-acetylmuramyl-(pentapeptide) pyrophosphoryl-undecaprenol N-acetylglucosamine transferase